MLVRELAARYVGRGGTILLDADPEVVKDVDRAGPVAPLEADAQPSAGDVVVLSVERSALEATGDPDPLTERLSRVSEPGAVVLLLLPTPVIDLPAGRLAQAAVTAGLAFVELAPIEPGWSVRAAVVCRPSRRAVAVRGYLADDPVLPAEQAEQPQQPAETDDLERQGVRLAWEWGLADARARAFEHRTATQVEELQGQIAALQEQLRERDGELAAARRATEQAQQAAANEAQRRAAVQQSPSFLVGRAVLTTRHHPLQGARQLAGAVRRGVRQRRDLG